MIGLHAFYDVAPNTRVAALVAYDTFNEGDYLYALEAVHVTGNYRVEGRIGRFESAFEPATLIDLVLFYNASPALDLRAALHNVNYDDGLGFYTVTSLGIGCNVAPHIALGGPRNPMMFSYSPYY